MNLYLIDGNSYVYRAYYAIRGLSNSKGFPTNAIYGFTNMLLKIIREKKPDNIVVTFDSPVPTERHRIYEEYKAQRPETPGDLVEQLPYIRKIISAFNIKIFEIPGYEADDIIGTIAKKVASEEIDVFIVTADKDMLQLVNNKVKIYDPMKDKILDERYTKERFGVVPERITEFMALTGDAVDNIPGVPGIGPKSAAALLGHFGDLDSLYQRLDEVPYLSLRGAKSVHRKLNDHREAAQLARQLTLISRDVASALASPDISRGAADTARLNRLFDELQFGGMLRQRCLRA